MDNRQPYRLSDVLGYPVSPGLVYSKGARNLRRVWIAPLLAVGLSVVGCSPFQFAQQGLQQGLQAVHENGYGDGAAVPSRPSSDELSAQDGWTPLDTHGPYHGTASPPELVASDAVPPPTEEPPSNALTGTVTENPGADAAEGVAAEIRSAGDTLPLEDGTDGPPVPPWATAAEIQSGADRNVRMASVQMPAPPGERQGSGETSPATSGHEFDPFSGTQFASWSQASSDHGRLESATPSVPTVPPDTHPIAADVSEAESWVAVGTASNSTPPQVKPLEMMGPLPNHSPSMTTVAGEATSLTAPPPSASISSSSIIPLSRLRAAERSASATATPGEPATAGKSTDQPATTPERTDSAAVPSEKAEDPADGWQAVDATSDTHWKERDNSSFRRPPSSSSL